jgi:hypothetical protein
MNWSNTVHYTTNPFFFSASFQLLIDHQVITERWLLKRYGFQLTPEWQLSVHSLRQKWL